MIKLKTTWSTVMYGDSPVIDPDGVRDYYDAQWEPGVDISIHDGVPHNDRVLCVIPKDEAQRQAILADNRFTIVES
jgi:hypothetical protein